MDVRMGRRQVIEVAGLGHKAPLPLAVRLGNVVFSSGIQGKDPASGEVPEGAAEQARFMFANVAAVLKAAGGTVEDIGSMTLAVRSLDYRREIDAEWLRMFPDEHDRPARHTSVADLRGATLMQCQITAVLDETKVEQQ
jgi:2-iminobutanoate/2-iminopropanoate deaminase